MIKINAGRLLVVEGKLWDGGVASDGVELPCDEAAVRREINSLLVKHAQRDFPPPTAKEILRQELAAQALEKGKQKIKRAKKGEAK